VLFQSDRQLKSKESAMPHVLVKLYSGRSERLKARLAEAVSQAVVATLKLDEKSVSVAIEDVEPDNWTREVYKPDIQHNPKIYKKPGYDPDE
jgi:4-oxalocrotonate tautomerase